MYVSVPLKIKSILTYLPVNENYFSYFSTDTYAVDTQKNHLNEMVLLSTQKIS